MCPSRTFPFLAFLLPAVGLSPVLEAQEGTQNVRALATGPYSEATALLEKTLFRIDIARLHLRFGPETAAELATLLEGRDRTSVLADSAAQVAMRSRNAWARLTFLRDVSFEQFLGGIRESVQAALKGGVVDSTFVRALSDSLPSWYAPLRGREVREGDRMTYRIRGDSLHTVVRTAEGRVLVDHRDADPQAPLSVLGGYFSPGSDFREGLLNSLFRSGNSPIP